MNEKKKIKKFETASTAVTLPIHFLHSPIYTSTEKQNLSSNLATFTALPSSKSPGPFRSTVQNTALAWQTKTFKKKTKKMTASKKV